MAILLTFLEYTTELIEQTTKVLEQANKEQRFERLFASADYTRTEPVFFQTYLALREVEVYGLRLLHEVAVLKQMLEHEQQARNKGKQLERLLKAQEHGDGHQ